MIQVGFLHVIWYLFSFLKDVRQHGPVVVHVVHHQRITYVDFVVKFLESIVSSYSFLSFFSLVLFPAFVIRFTAGSDGLAYVVRLVRIKPQSQVLLPCGF